MEWTIIKGGYTRQAELTMLSDIEELEEYKEMLAENKAWDSVIVSPSDKKIWIYDDYVE